jgi:hypothetical protein
MVNQTHIYIHSFFLFTLRVSVVPSRNVVSHPPSHGSIFSSEWDTLHFSPRIADTYRTVKKTKWKHRHSRYIITTRGVSKSHKHNQRIVLHTCNGKVCNPRLKLPKLPGGM